MDEIRLLVISDQSFISKRQDLKVKIFQKHVASKGQPFYKLHQKHRKALKISSPFIMFDCSIIKHQAFTLGLS